MGRAGDPGSWLALVTTASAIPRPRKSSAACWLSTRSGRMASVRLPGAGGSAARFHMKPPTASAPRRTAPSAAARERPPREPVRLVCPARGQAAGTSPGRYRVQRSAQLAPRAGSAAPRPF